MSCASLSYFQVKEMEANVKHQEKFAMQASLHYEYCKFFSSYHFQVWLFYVLHIDIVTLKSISPWLTTEKKKLQRCQKAYFKSLEYSEDIPNNSQLCLSKTTFLLKITEFSSQLVNIAYVDHLLP